jgi:hypothetical protein
MTSAHVTFDGWTVIHLSSTTGPSALIHDPNLFSLKRKQKRCLLRGRCYGRNFRRFLPILGEKIGVFLKNQCCDHFFAKINSSLRKKGKIFAKFFGKNILKFITSVPGVPNHPISVSLGTKGIVFNKKKSFGLCNKTRDRIRLSSDKVGER